jgi:hypothetical protein
MFQSDGHTIKYKFDNEFDLLFVVVYQSIVQLSYTDKLLDTVQAEFRERYKNSLVCAKNTALYGAQTAKRIHQLQAAAARTRGRSWLYMVNSKTTSHLFSTNCCVACRPNSARLNSRALLSPCARLR